MIGNIYAIDGLSVATEQMGSLRPGLIILQKTEQGLLLIQTIGYYKYPNVATDKTHYPNKILGFPNIFIISETAFRNLNLYCVYDEDNNV